MQHGHCVPCLLSQWLTSVGDHLGRSKSFPPALRQALSMAAAALLPDTEEDFRSQRFWDGFFRARGAAAFEWYGEWRQLRPIVEPLCKGRRILIPGCGNSELSAQLCGPFP